MYFMKYEQGGSSPPRRAAPDGSPARAHCGRVTRSTPVRCPAALLTGLGTAHPGWQNLPTTDQERRATPDRELAALPNYPDPTLPTVHVITAESGT